MSISETVGSPEAPPSSDRDLEDRLSRPSPGLVDDLRRLDGDLLVLGAGGKMGPSLCRLARRALDEAGNSQSRVLAVSRWSDTEAEKELREHGVETVAFDLASDSLAQLPHAENVVFMVGAKFGTTGNEHAAWASNVLLPGRVAEVFATSRIAAFSTGNVYPFVPAVSAGCTESDLPGPVGEYAMSCLGRERMFEHAARTRGTRVSLLRLNYAVDLRYGVLADIATAVRDGRPVDVTTGYVNVVWQGYANEVALRSLLHASAPDPFVLNVTGPERASVRRLAIEVGEVLGCEPVLSGEEAPTALLNDASRCHGLFGYPDVPLRRLVDWQARWCAAGGRMWDKPTHFQTRDGRF